MALAHVGLVKAFLLAGACPLPGLLISTTARFLFPVYSSRHRWPSPMLKNNRLSGINHYLLPDGHRRNFWPRRCRFPTFVCRQVSPLDDYVDSVRINPPMSRFCPVRNHSWLIKNRSREKNTTLRTRTEQTHRREEERVLPGKATILCVVQSRLIQFRETMYKRSMCAVFNIKY